ncbi:MAG: hypothetical protein ABW145_05960 [Candidatus Thiodiazotropha sp.]
MAGFFFTRGTAFFDGGFFLDAVDGILLALLFFVLLADFFLLRCFRVIGRGGSAE